MALAVLGTNVERLDSELKALFVKNNLHTDIQEYLGAPEQNCTSLKTFSNWVEDKSELKDEVLAHTSQSSSKAQLANLKQAWRESVGIVERRLKRISEGANEDYADEPLDSEVQKSISVRKSRRRRRIRS